MRKILACMIFFGLFFEVPVFCMKKAKKKPKETTTIESDESEEVIESKKISKKTRKRLLKKWHDELESCLQKIRKNFEKQPKDLQDFVLEVGFSDACKRALIDMFIMMEFTLTKNKEISKEVFQDELKERMAKFLFPVLHARLGIPFSDNTKHLFVGSLESFLAFVFKEHMRTIVFFDFQEAMSVAVSLISDWLLNMEDMLRAARILLKAESIKGEGEDK